MPGLNLDIWNRESYEKLSSDEKSFIRSAFVIEFLAMRVSGVSPELTYQTMGRNVRLLCLIGMCSTSSEKM